jgi:hypothetical protein
MPLICGYQVVRKPEHNFDAANRGMYSDCVPSIGNNYYSGIDRMPWFDSDELFYDGQLPENERKLRKAIGQSNSDLAGLDLCKELESAEALLKISPLSELSEVAAFYSAKLKNIKGSFESNVCMDLLGFDVFEHGGVSLIRHGLFDRSEFSKEWADKLNPYGLFSDSTLCEQYVTDYWNMLPRDEDWKPAVIDYVEVYRLSDVE